MFLSGTKNSNYPPTDTWLSVYKTNLQGEIKWTLYYGGYGVYVPTAVLPTADGGCVVIAWWWDFNTYPIPPLEQGDIFIMKVDSNGVVGVPDKPVKQRYPAVSIYPNPFSDHLSFRSSQLVGEFRFEFFNSRGERMTALQVSPGEQIKTAGLPPGLYFYRMVFSDGSCQSGKLVRQ
jgi:hypothetical protein